MIHRLESFTTPEPTSTGAVGRLTEISYQRNSVLPPVESTVWPVQTTIRPIDGSTAEMACMRRASCEWSRFVVPFWGAFAEGGANVGTVIDLPVTSIWGCPGLFGLSRTACTVIRFPVPQMS